jgi:hypothetical protein
MKKTESANIIYTDGYRTKDLIWEYYNGFQIHLGNYLMYYQLNKRENRVHVAGMIRYSYLFQLQIRNFLVKFTDSIEAVDIDRFNSLYPDIRVRDTFTRDDWLFLAGFYEHFMVISGIKNIVRELDMRTNMQKIYDKYDLERDTE